MLIQLCLRMRSLSVPFFFPFRIELNFNDVGYYSPQAMRADGLEFSQELDQTLRDRTRDDGPTPSAVYVESRTGSLIHQGYFAFSEALGDFASAASLVSLLREVIDDYYANKLANYDARVGPLYYSQGGSPDELYEQFSPFWQHKIGTCSSAVWPSGHRTKISRLAEAVDTRSKVPGDIKPTDPDTELIQIRNSILEGRQRILDEWRRTRTWLTIVSFVSIISLVLFMRYWPSQTKNDEALQILERIMRSVDEIRENQVTAQAFDNAVGDVNENISDLQSSAAERPPLISNEVPPYRIEESRGTKIIRFRQSESN